MLMVVCHPCRPLCFSTWWRTVWKRGCWSYRNASASWWQEPSTNAPMPRNGAPTAYRRSEPCWTCDKERPTSCLFVQMYKIGCLNLFSGSCHRHWQRHADVCFSAGHVIVITGKVTRNGCCSIKEMPAVDSEALEWHVASGILQVPLEMLTMWTWQHV